MSKEAPEKNKRLKIKIKNKRLINKRLNKRLKIKN